MSKSSIGIIYVTVNYILTKPLSFEKFIHMEIELFLKENDLVTYSLALILVFSDLHRETNCFRFGSGRQLCAEVSPL